MANPAVRATTHLDFSTATSLAVGKPAGLAVGDLLVLFIGSTSGFPSALPSGFEQLAQQGNAQTNRLTVATKTATQADTEASTFTVGNSGAYRTSLILVAVQDPGSVEHSASVYSSATQTVIVSSGFTPAVTGDLLLVGTHNNSGVSSMSTVNNNPTWTMRYDDETWWIHQVRSASYTTGATGNIRVVLASAGNGSSVVVAIAPAGAAAPSAFITPMRGIW